MNGRITKRAKRCTAIQLLRNIHGKNNEIHIISNLPCIEHTEKKNMEDSPHFAIRKAGRRRISKKSRRNDVLRLFISIWGDFIVEDLSNPWQFAFREIFPVSNRVSLNSWAGRGIEMRIKKNLSKDFNATDESAGDKKTIKEWLCVENQTSFLSNQIPYQSSWMIHKLVWLPQWCHFVYVHVFIQNRFFGVSFSRRLAFFLGGVFLPPRLICTLLKQIYTFPSQQARNH